MDVICFEWGEIKKMGTSKSTVQLVRVASLKLTKLRMLHCGFMYVYDRRLHFAIYRTSNLHFITSLVRNY